MRGKRCKSNTKYTVAEVAVAADFVNIANVAGAQSTQSGVEMATKVA